MRTATVDGRLVVVIDGTVVDVARASGGRFGPDPHAAFEEWDRFAEWALALAPGAEALEETALGPPAPSPRQVFAIGLNYRGHVRETGHTVPEVPPTFTKFPSCLTGPRADVALPSTAVDWEVELVAVIGRRAEHVREADAWAHVAGLTVGQDLSERRLQRLGPVPQFSLAKSFPGFGPLGPVLVTPDELADRDDVEIGCSIGGESLQKARTSELIFSVPELVARLSAVCPLLPGDVIFTGTPDGIGAARDPRRFLVPGEVLVSYAVGIGELRNRMVPATSPFAV